MRNMSGIFCANNASHPSLGVRRVLVANTQRCNSEMEADQSM
jgi:hypothetical protein